MKELKVKLESIETVKEFVALTNKCAYDIDLVSGRYAVDAKSIMGIFSLDLSRALTLVIHADEENSAKFIEEAEKFIVE